MTKTEISPSIKEVSGYNIVDCLIGKVKLSLLFLKLFLKLIDEGFEMLAFLDGNFGSWSAIGSCCCYKLNLHVDKL
jgi:hypothetical protein